jgi:DNA repair protein RadC
MKTRFNFVEQFKVLLLNRANKVIGMYEVSSGTTVNIVADPRPALLQRYKPTRPRCIFFNKFDAILPNR